MFSATLIAYTLLLGAPLTGCGGGGSAETGASSANPTAASVADAAASAALAPEIASTVAAADDASAVGNAGSAAAALVDAAVSQSHADALAAPETAASTPVDTAASSPMVDTGAGTDPAVTALLEDPTRTALAAASSASTAVITSAIRTAAKPLMERVELVANDGSSEIVPIPNHWGMHQPRITSHADGTIRALYIKPGAGNLVSWRLMKRNKDTGVWAQEATGLSQDDVTLSRDPVSDVAHVLAWPQSVPTLFSSPAFAARVVPGSWQNLATTARHYGNTGIGADGLLCLKVSVEQKVILQTTGTNTQFNCGRYNSTTTLWTWAGQQTQFVGSRSAYDYLFPGGFGITNSLVGTTQMDLYKTAANLPKLSASQGDYVFNGVNAYGVQANDASTWKLSVAVSPLLVASTSSTAPLARQIDAFIDRSQRQVISYQVDGTGNANDRGIYYRISGSAGNTISMGKWPGLPTYGYVRVFDDAKGRMWLLWSNLGSQSTQLVLYRVQLQGSTIALLDKTDLSSSLAGYAIQGSLLLTLPRGGHSIGNAVDGQMIACDGKFANGALAACYPNGVNKQRIVHFRLRLPD